MSVAPGQPRTRTPAPVLIDADPGIDDALALLLAFRSPEWRVEGVTTVAGNVPVEVGTANVGRILGVVRPSRPPLVAVGAGGPLSRPLVTATRFHGEDGLGGLAALRGADGCPCFPAVPLVRHPGDAADLLIRFARRWREELIVVTLGPLTNLALALERDAEALRSVRAIVTMGGSVAEGGNVTAAAEYNVFVDPEAAARVLAAGLPLTLVPLDVTHRVVWPATRVERLAHASDPAARFAHALAQRGLGLARGSGEEGITMHDPLAVAVALDSSLVEAPELPVAVETAGVLTRGVTIADRRRRPAARTGSGSCRVALRVDARRFLDLYEARVCPASA